MFHVELCLFSCDECGTGGQHTENYFPCEWMVLRNTDWIIWTLTILGSTYI
jgi:hypothetical protein